MPAAEGGRAENREVTNDNIGEDPSEEVVVEELPLPRNLCWPVGLKPVSEVRIFGQLHGVSVEPKPRRDSLQGPARCRGDQEGDRLNDEARHKASKAEEKKDRGTAVAVDVRLPKAKDCFQRLLRATEAIIGKGGFEKRQVHREKDEACQEERRQGHHVGKHRGSAMANGVQVGFICRHYDLLLRYHPVGRLTSYYTFSAF